MALTERHKWCATKIIDSFGSELDTETVQLFMRQDANLQKFTAFFKGESTGRLFVLYQPDVSENEVRIFVVIIYITFTFIFILHLILIIHIQFIIYI